MKNWEILLPATIDPTGPDSISEFASFTSIDTYGTQSEFLSDCSRFDAIIVRTAELSETVIDAASSLKVIAKHGAGLDNIDIPAASRNGVIVCNTPGVNSRSVAEHAVSLMISTRKHIVSADKHVREGGWSRHEFANHELSGDTVGLLGFGNIARDVVTLLQGFDVEHLTYDPFVDQSEMPAGVEKVPSILSLFEHSDVVSIHTPLTEQTRHAVGETELEALGPSGSIINTSRGGIIDEDALVSGLENGQIATAGLDVFEEEPPERGDPLLTRDDVILTPHIGGLTHEALERMSQRAAKNVRCVFEGGMPESTVNLDDLESDV